MLIRLRNSKAQTTAEYAILIALVVGAAMAMQVYVKRGLQGRVRDVVDFTGSGGEVGSEGDALSFSSGQYEPYYSESTGSSNQQIAETENVGQGGTVGRTSTTTTSGTRTQTIKPSPDEITE